MSREELRNKYVVKLNKKIQQVAQGLEVLSKVDKQLGIQRGGGIISEDKITKKSDGSFVVTLNGKPTPFSTYNEYIQKYNEYEKEKTSRKDAILAENTRTMRIIDDLYGEREHVSEGPKYNPTKIDFDGRQKTFKPSEFCDAEVNIGELQKAVAIATHDNIKWMQVSEYDALVTNYNAVKKKLKATSIDCINLNETVRILQEQITLLTAALNNKKIDSFDDLIKSSKPGSPASGK
jgi:hypothetical protein